MTTANDTYDRLYAVGDFKYDLDVERQFVEDILLPYAGWSAGVQVVEVGAGKCHHAEILRTLGFDVTAVEASLPAIDAARLTYPDLAVVHADAAEWEPDKPGHVFARGMSWWHYELDGKNQRGVDVPAMTGRLIDRWVASGCTFVLQIVTDLSGRRAVGKVHDNRVEDYRDLFANYGDIEIADWNGRPIIPGQRHARGVLVKVSRP